MIQVKIDREVRRKFCRNLFANTKVGDIIYLHECGEWRTEENLYALGWGSHVLQYDEEFTEWLKENRPEVFI